MHEYSLMQRIVETILKNLETGADFQGRQVKEVILQIGALDIHSPDSFRQAFEVLVQGTPLAASVLHLEVIPGTISCLKCGYHGANPAGVDGHDPFPCIECPQCGTLTSVTGGRGIESIELVLEE